MFTVNVSNVDMLFWEFAEKGRSGIYMDTDWESVLVTGTEENTYGRYYPYFNLCPIQLPGQNIFVQETRLKTGL